LSLRDNRRGCREVSRAAKAKLDGVNEKIRQLTAIRRALRTLLATCGTKGERDCPILDALNGPEGEL
jgi:hypothetical protein